MAAFRSVTRSQSKPGKGASGRQRHAPFLRLGILPVKQRRVPDRADAHVTALVGDLHAELRALIAFGAEETQFHQFVRAKLLLQLREKIRREPALAEFQRGIELLAESAEKRFLRAGEWEVIHDFGEAHAKAR